MKDNGELTVKRVSPFMHPAQASAYEALKFAMEHGVKTAEFVDDDQVIRETSTDTFESLVADCEKDIKRIDVMLVERDRLIALEATVDGLKVRLDALEREMRDAAARKDS